jgi:hypothetical protein
MSRTEPAPVVHKFAVEIRRDVPGISEDLVKRDEFVVRQALMNVAPVFVKRGFGSSDAEAATLAGWKRVCTGHTRWFANADLEVNSFTEYVTDFGLLVIKSKPDEARVDLDGQEDYDTTE